MTSPSRTSIPGRPPASDAGSLALLQYTSGASSLSSNVRLRWEYRPGSELFLVYSEARSTLPVRGTELQNRGIVLKITRLFRW